MYKEHAFTKLVKVVQSHASFAMIHNLSSRQQRERVKELEDGVARLVDGQNYHTIFLHTETIEERGWPLTVYHRCCFQKQYHDDHSNMR